jgi:hypothetical protein
MKAYILLFIFFLSTLSSVFSQKILVLDLSGMRSKRIKYNSGEYIWVKVLNDKTTYSGFLEVTSDTSFYVNDNLVFLDSLSAIVKYRRGMKMISKQAFLAGGILAIISGINNGVTKGDVFPQDDSYIVPASFLGLGVIFMPFWRKTYRINDKNTIAKILDLTPIPTIEDSP